MADQPPQKLPSPKYVNFCKVMHTPNEFFMDFASLHPDVNTDPANQGSGKLTGNMESRVVMSPSHAKRLMQVLVENVRQFEENFGEIDPAPDKTTDIRLN